MSKILKIKIQDVLLVSMLLFSVTMPIACSDDDVPGKGQVIEVPTVDAHLTFSLPKSIIGTGDPRQRQRQTAPIVQVDENASSFRGLDNIYLFSYTEAPGSSTSKSGRINALKKLTLSDLHDTPETNYILYNNVSVPVGTKYFSFYTKAIDAEAEVQPQSFGDLMNYGTLEAVGFTEEEYANNSSIRFRPVQINKSTEPCAGSEVGQRLVALLNDLISTEAAAPAPNNKWATTDDPYMQAAFKMLTDLHTANSFNVQWTLGLVHSLMNQLPSDARGKALADAIDEKIKAACAVTPADLSETIRLKNIYQSYPADVHLPEGAARFVWNASQNRFEASNLQQYGKELNITATSDYVYPPNLQYLAISPLLASESLESSNYDRFETWNEMLDSVYLAAESSVSLSTRSVAMVKQLQYAVGRLDTRVKMAGGTYYDAAGKAVDLTNGFVLKSIIVGGQREVGYNFKPISGAHTYAIWDTNLNPVDWTIKPGTNAGPNYTLGLETPENEVVYVALELQNNSSAFLGADGYIATGGTFYLVAALDPQTAHNYSYGSLDQVFLQDFSTQVDITIRNGNKDVNGDGVPDTDKNRDGVPDVYLKDPTTGLPLGVDTDGDGVANDFDASGDGLPDTFVTEDSNSDGIPDRAGWDTTGDGSIDIPIAPNPDADPADPLTFYPATPTQKEGLATATYGMPNLNVPVAPYKILGVSVDLNWRKGIEFFPNL